MLGTGIWKQQQTKITRISSANNEDNIHKTGCTSDIIRWHPCQPCGVSSSSSQSSLKSQMIFLGRPWTKTKLDNYKRKDMPIRCTLCWICPGCLIPAMTAKSAGPSHLSYHFLPGGWSKFGIISWCHPSHWLIFFKMVNMHHQPDYRSIFHG